MKVSEVGRMNLANKGMLIGMNVLFTIELVWVIGFLP